MKAFVKILLFLITVLLSCSKDDRIIAEQKVQIDTAKIQRVFNSSCSSQSNNIYEMEGENSNYYIITKFNEALNADSLNKTVKSWPYILITYKENFDSSFLEKNCPNYSLNQFAYYHFIELVSFKIDSNAYIFNDSGFIQEPPFSYCGKFIRTKSGKTLVVKIPTDFPINYDKEVLIDYGKRCYPSTCQIGCSAYLKRIEYK
jgi:hypothetical protein